MTALAPAPLPTAPAPATMLGEIAADGNLVLVADGQGPALEHAARLLQTLTPLIKPTTNPPGGLTLPLSWAAVVQLSATFGASWRPGPRLCAWVTEQYAARTGDRGQLTIRPPAGLEPRPYQVAAARMIGDVGSAILGDEPGTGKTVSAVLGLVERSRVLRGVSTVTPVVVVCPNAVVTSWVEHFQAWAPYWRVVPWTGSPARRRRRIGTADVYVASYGTASRDAGSVDAREIAKGNSPLIELEPRFVVADECVPPGTPIDTPTGPRPIETLEVGDEVLGVDHATGELVTTTVRHTFTNYTRSPLVHVGDVAMTPNHPVWTARGYVPAISVRHDDLICEVQPDGEGAREVRMVRHDQGARRLPQQAGAPVLLDEVLGAVAHGDTGSASDPRRVPAQLAEPVPGSGGAGEVAGCRTRAGLPGTDRRERSRADGAAGASRGSLGLAGRGGRADGGQFGPDGAVVVQGRRRLPRAADRGRAGRREPQRPEGSRAGRPEGRVPARAGLDGAAVPEPSSALGTGDGARGDQGARRVHNIETGTGNYVAAGLLVHNCHKIKDSSTRQSRAVRNLAARANAVGGGFVGLSGTPITHSPKDLWPALYAMEPAAWPSSERWVHRYCDTIPGDYQDQVIGLNQAREPEFRNTILGQFRRVAKADVLAHLPPKVYSVRRVEIPARYRQVYDDMEASMLAELPDGGQLEVMGVLDQLTRLRQLASAAADVRTWTEVVEDPETGMPLEKTHQQVTLKAPSWKVDELLEVLDERPGQQVATYASSRQLVVLAGEAATKAGYRVGYVVGGQTKRQRDAAVTAFQAGELDLMCVTTGAGGVGLTLTAAGTAVFLERPWSLVEALQAEDRQHRIGSERHECVEIVDIVAENTVESRVRRLLLDKAQQLSDLVQDPRVVAELLGGAGVRDLRRKRAS